MLAPGDGEAKPGVTATNFREPAKLATDGGRKSAIENSKFKLFFVHVSSVAHFVGLEVCWVRFPRASTLSASFAGGLNGFFIRPLENTKDAQRIQTRPTAHASPVS